MGVQAVGVSAATSSGMTVVVSAATISGMMTVGVQAVVVLFLAVLLLVVAHGGMKMKPILAVLLQLQLLVVMAVEECWEEVREACAESYSVRIARASRRPAFSWCSRQDAGSSSPRSSSKWAE